MAGPAPCAAVWWDASDGPKTARLGQVHENVPFLLLEANGVLGFPDPDVLTVGATSGQAVQDGQSEYRFLHLSTACFLLSI